MIFGKIYGATPARSIDEMQSTMFVNGMSIEKSAATRDALFSQGVLSQPDSRLLVNPCTKNCNFCLCKHSMLDPLEEPRHSAPNLYASDLTPWELNMAASSQWISVNYSFKLYTTYSSRFWPFWILLMVSIYPVVKAMHHIYIYIYLYICL